MFVASGVRANEFLERRVFPQNVEVWIGVQVCSVPNARRHRPPEQCDTLFLLAEARRDGGPSHGVLPEQVGSDLLLGIEASEPEVAANPLSLRSFPARQASLRRYALRNQSDRPKVAMHPVELCL